MNAMQQVVFDGVGKERDLVLLAPTGSGKTLAYLLPLINKLKVGEKGVQALILVPSRELALQIEQVFKQMSTGFKVNCCYGGHSVKVEVQNFSNPPTVLIGTPGRIAFHLRNQHFDESGITHLVLDEFDKSLEFGFQTDMDFIISTLRSLRQRILVSATAMEDIPFFTGINEPIFVNFLRDSATKPKFLIKTIKCEPEEKLETFFKLLCKVASSSTLIFCNHRETVDRISDLLIDKDLIHDVFHGGMEQDDRERALVKFRNGSIKILITTDLAARGLDIPELENIIHYQLPPREDAFIHRNGRTARMNMSGTIYAMLGMDERYPFLEHDVESETLDGVYEVPADSKWQTLYLSAGRKDKVNKVDVVGFLIKVGGLSNEEVGLIEVKDFSAYAAIRRSKMAILLERLSGKKLKQKKIKVEAAF